VNVAAHHPVDPDEVDFIAIRAQGPGGQNVNKVSCAVHARFDVNASSLPAPVKERMLALRDARITRDGVVVIRRRARQPGRPGDRSAAGWTARRAPGRPRPCGGRWRISRGAC
jgi:protein subunit release factor B